MFATLKSRLWSLELILGLGLTVGIAFCVLFSGWLTPDAGAIDLTARLMAPFQSAAHPFGTDPLGRDVMARVFAGGWISLQVGFISVAGSVIIGVAVGLIAGYYRGIWDILVMRFADVQLALPFILLAITIIAIVGGSLTNTILLLIASQWVQYARLVRAQVLALREREFVLAARAAGIAVDARGAAVHQRLHAATPTQGLQQAGRARVLVARRGRRRQVQHPCGQTGQTRQRAGVVQIAHQRHQALRPQRRHAVSLRGQSQHATTGAQCLRGTLAHISAAHNEDTGLTKSGRTQGLRLEHGRSERKSSLRF